MCVKAGFSSRGYVLMGAESHQLVGSRDSFALLILWFGGSGRTSLCMYRPEKHVFHGMGPLISQPQDVCISYERTI